MGHRIVRPMLIVLIPAYIIAGSFAVYKYQHPHDKSVFDLNFRFGALTERILTGGVSVGGDQMLFIPYFLSAAASLHNGLLFIYLVKNTVFFSLICACARLMWNDTAPERRRALAAVLLFGMFFPQLILHGFSIEYGEGYLTAFLPVLFVGALRAAETRGKPVFIALAFINAFLFLTKGSMLPLSVAICIFYYWMSGRRSVLIIFVSCLLAASAIWGLHNFRNTGRFTIMSSHGGINFYKGNNEFTMDVYPDYSLDVLSGRMGRDVPQGARMDEWEMNRFYTAKALDFIKGHPAEAAKLFMIKIYTMFFGITNVIDDNGGRFPVLLGIGSAYMLVFRLIFLACAFCALRAIIREKGRALLRGGGDARASAVYLGFIAAYSAPYLIAYGYERHFIPLVPVTLFYLAWRIKKKGQQARV